MSSLTCRDCKLEGKLRGESFRLLRNFFFAKHGHIFQSADLTEYFSRFDWYKPTRTVAFEELSEAERWNIEIIRKFEQMNENSQTVVWGPEKEGVWQDHFVMAAGWGDRFIIYADNRMEFLFSQMSELQLIKGLAGTYEIRGNVLIFAVPQFLPYLRPDGRRRAARRRCAFSAFACFRAAHSSSSATQSISSSRPTIISPFNLTTVSPGLGKV